MVHEHTIKEFSKKLITLVHEHLQGGCSSAEIIGNLEFIKHTILIYLCKGKKKD